MILSWLAALLRRRFGRSLGVVVGIAVTVALLADLGAFLEQSAASMTARAISTVSVDWQIEVVPSASPDAILAAAREAAPLTSVETVGYAQVGGFEFVSPEGVQATGGGKAVGIEATYYASFGQGFRMLTGDTSGAVLLQQTSANLHAAPGDTVTIHRIGLSDATIKVIGIVDLTTADSFFQAIGIPRGAAPQAPPDNAVVLPMAEWKTLFDPQAQARPDSVRLQLHARIDHAGLPADPNDAYVAVTRTGHNLEERVAGSATLANNLAAQLDATRADAFYTRVLFLFLGTPGALLSALLTVAVARSGGDQRRRDQTLLRLRGAAPGQILSFAAAEAIASGVLGSILGIVVATVTRPLFGLQPSGVEHLRWWAIAAGAGLLLALCGVLLPAWVSPRQLTVAEARRPIGEESPPVWQRIYLDLICLAIGGIVLWQTAATGYQVVLATEGVAAIAVDYTAFLAPLLLWIGMGLLTIRLGRLALRHGRGVIGSAIAPWAGAVAPAVTSALFHQRRRLAAGAALAALAVAFATSTAIFNTTYQNQALVDAELTNGSDVTISGTGIAPAAAALEQLRAIPGVVAAAPIQHRFAYVGTDLQDLYGIDPATIGNATAMANAYFANGDAAGSLRALAANPAAVLVSDETVSDFQLNLGDTINLRLQDKSGTYQVLPFLFAGVVREFPTAPRDSFIVANADYVAKMTGVNAREVVLLRTSGDRGAVKAAAQDIVRDMPGVRVSDLSEAIHQIGSSLTAVDLSGLTRLELSFAVLLAIGATGLVLWLGLADRRRGFAILSILGARPRVLLVFISTEAAVVLIGGIVFGLLTGALIAQVLVVDLQGVFDPPPEALSMPWAYLAFVLGAVVIVTAVAVAGGLRQSQIAPMKLLRALG